MFDRIRGALYGWKHGLSDLLTDQLTGAFDRNVWRVFAEKIIAQCMRNQKSLALVMIDVDGLKTINDKHGHPIGDRALGDVAQAIRDHIREGSDLLARYGGDEFILIFPTSERGMGIVLERILDSLPQGLSISYGVCNLIPNRSLDASDVLRDMIEEADQQLLKVKEAKRNNRSNI